MDGFRNVRHLEVDEGVCFAMKFPTIDKKTTSWIKRNIKICLNRLSPIKNTEML